MHRLQNLNQLEILKIPNLFIHRIYEALLFTFIQPASSMLFFDLDAPLKIGFDSIINRKIYTITLERKENAFLESYFSKILSLLGVKF